MKTTRIVLAFVYMLFVCGVAGPVSAAGAETQAAVRPPKLIGIEFIGRSVADLDRSIAFYKALGFEQDPLAKPEWRERDEISEQLYNVRGFQTRMAKMFTMNAQSGQRFVVYLRELKGLPRTNHAGHAAWDPGAAGLGLVVADAPKLWQKLKEQDLLRARNTKGELIAPPNAPAEWLGFITDPDGLDIGIVQQRPAANGRAALQPGVNNVSLVLKDSAKAQAFYGATLGGQIANAEPQWFSGEYYDASTGGTGNEMRVFMARFPEGLAPDHRITYQLIEYRKPQMPVRPRKITDIGVSYVGIEVHNLAAWVEKAVAGGAKVVSDRPIVTMRSGTREVMLEDPDVGGFVLLFEHPPAAN
jgi:catechol 2,3-dioxygenase-like lactoylglutathione lyase family enzyme